MTITSGFFNSVNGDRRYKADFFAEYFASFIANGVFPNPSTGLQVIANDNMTVTLKPGKAWINGYYLSNDADYTLQLDVADGVLNRIDRIVLQLNYLNREIVPVVKKGTFASTPVAPTLQRDADAYEISLADVYISAGATNITQANITDTRLDTEHCGIVHGTVDQVDTTTIFNQYQAWFAEITGNTETEISDWKAQQEQAFNDWFDTVKGILEGDLATNLANRISTLEHDFASHQADDTAHGIGDKTTLLTTEKSSIVGAINEVFQYGNNVKANTVGALLSVDDSLPISNNDSWGEIIDSIGNISTKTKFRFSHALNPIRSIVPIYNFSTSSIHYLRKDESTYYKFQIWNYPEQLVRREEYNFNGSLISSIELPLSSLNSMSNTLYYNRDKLIIRHQVSGVQMYSVFDFDFNMLGTFTYPTLSGSNPGFNGKGLVALLRDSFRNISITDGSGNLLWEIPYRTNYTYGASEFINDRYLITSYYALGGSTVNSFAIIDTSTGNVVYESSTLAMSEFGAFIGKLLYYVELT